MNNKTITKIFINFNDIIEILSPDKFGSNDGYKIFNIMKFDKYEGKRNTVEFIKYCFSLHHIDIIQVLQKKFPNGEINVQSDNIIVNF